MERTPARLVTLSRCLRCVFFVGALAVVAPAGDLDPQYKALVGQNFFLKVDVVRIESTIGGKDVTNVHPDGRVYYRGKVGSGFVKAKETDTAEDFAAEARRDEGGNVRIYKRGSQVTIHSVDPKSEEVNVGITVQSGSKSRISFKLNKGFSPADFQRVFEGAFAKNEAELAGAAATVTIGLGMTTAEIIKLKGNPNTRAVLGAKTMFTYPDMKLVFENDKLVDVQ